MQIKQSKVPQLIKVLQEGNEEQVRIILNDILSKSISYYDNYETFYHGFLVGLFHQDNVKSLLHNAPQCGKLLLAQNLLQGLLGLHHTRAHHSRAKRELPIYGNTLALMLK